MGGVDLLNERDGAGLAVQPRQCAADAFAGGVGIQDLFLGASDCVDRGIDAFLKDVRGGRVRQRGLQVEDGGIELLPVRGGVRQHGLNVTEVRVHGGLRLNDRRAFAFFLRGDLHACEPDQRDERQHDEGG